MLIVDSSAGFDCVKLAGDSSVAEAARPYQLDRGPFVHRICVVHFMWIATLSTAAQDDAQLTCFSLPRLSHSLDTQRLLFDNAITTLPEGVFADLRSLDVL